MREIFNLLNFGKSKTRTARSFKVLGHHNSGNDVFLPFPSSSLFSFSIAEYAPEMNHYGTDYGIKVLRKYS